MTKVERELIEEDFELELDLSEMPIGAETVTVEPVQHEVRVIDLHRPEPLDDERGERALLARIPLLSGSANKVTYLSYRAMGFTIKESAELATVNEHTVRAWRRADPEFAEVETRYIQQLQKHLAADLLRIEFMRNMRLAMNRDFQVFFKAACSLDTLTEREMDYLKVIRRLYTPNDLINLDRALMPETEDDGRYKASMTVTIEGKLVEDEVGRRAAARQLLDKFKSNAKLAGIESEPVESAEVDSADTD